MPGPARIVQPGEKGEGCTSCDRSTSDKLTSKQPGETGEGVLHLTEA